MSSGNGGLVIPVEIGNVSDEGIISFEIDVRYDPSLMQPQANPVDLTGTVSSGLTTVVNAETPGLLRIVAYGAVPISGDGILLNLRFTAFGAVDSSSPLIFERIMLNEDVPVVRLNDGKPEISY